jgi:hypothetical protein
VRVVSEREQATTQAEAKYVIAKSGQKVDARTATMLLGFRDIVAERMGYFLGRRLTQTEMSDKTETERKAVAEIRKDIRKNIPTWIKDANLKEYAKKTEELKTASEKLSGAAAPFRAKISPLARAQKYLDNVAIPDALKQLGTPIAPRFSLSKWINDTLEQEKKKKKAKANA